MMMDPLLFQGQSLDLQLCALGLLHGLELMGCRHRAGEGGRLGQVTERSTCHQNREERAAAAASGKGRKKKRDHSSPPVSKCFFFSFQHGVFREEN